MSITTYHYTYFFKLLPQLLILLYNSAITITIITALGTITTIPTFTAIVIISSISI